jgi:hypothetical protein
VLPASCLTSFRRALSFPDVSTGVSTNGVHRTRPSFPFFSPTHRRIRCAVEQL